MSTPKTPLPLSGGRTQLPHVEPLGSVKINHVKLFDENLILKAHTNNNGDNPKLYLYLDIEHPLPEFKQQKGTELHLGLSGVKLSFIANFRREPKRDSNVKFGRIDAYIPPSEIPKLLQALVRANLRSRSSERVAGGR